LKIQFDLGALPYSTKTVLLVPVLVILSFVLRGTPVFLYRRDLTRGERLP